MKIGIMGFGHLGQSLASGLLSSGAATKEEIYVTARSQATRDLAKEKFGVRALLDNRDLIEKTDIVFLVLPTAAFLKEKEAICAVNKAGKVFVSLMAEISWAEMAEVTGEAPMNRAIPNVGIANGNGIVAYTHTESPEVVRLLGSLGYAFEVKEEELGRVTVLASCGVGFAAYLLDCFENVGKEYGFEPEDTRKMVVNIFENALPAPDYATMVEQVATKGGVTEAGINVFKKEDTMALVKRVCDAALSRMK